MRYLYSLRRNDGKRNRKIWGSCRTYGDGCSDFPYNWSKQNYSGRWYSVSAGYPTQGEVDSKKIRKRMVRRALKALQTEVDGQTVFEKDNF